MDTDIHSAVEHLATSIELQLAALLSHELRTPLYAIRHAVTNIIAHESLTADELSKLLQILDRNTDRMINIVEKCLLLVNIRKDSNKECQEQMTKPINVQELIERTVQSFEAAPGDKPGTISVSISNNIPEWLMVCGDSFLLEQALANLIANAFQYGSNGDAHQEPFVELYVSMNEDSLVSVEVTDHGPGIPYAEQAQLFKPFYRAPTLRHKRPGGLGLGLALVRLVIESVGGKVGFHSTPGLGSTFWFSFPTNGVPNG
ncbi:MAG: HAMP domain-containing histidine kinase [Candidatus Melainabacteria bacterium]|nr:HAMP domain-containing histidine kinase [Candidatus Melainabacteria bacterium]